ncbi:MAG: hypothetical protein QOG63_2893 [Thermoleophilaceae bacterium]|nr:hypothetical protein [Thermoleophilaceae bacterium]
MLKCPIRSLPLTCAGAVIVAFALPAPSSAAAWLDREYVSPSAEDAATPTAAALAGNKDVVLTWTSGNTVEAAIRPAGGSFSASTLTPCDPSEVCFAASQPDVAADAHGNAIAVWLQGNAVKGALRTAGGDFTALPAISTSGSATSPRVAFTSDGIAIATWIQGRDVYAAARQPDASFGPPIPIYTGASNEAISPPDIATDGVGDAMIAFTANAIAESTALRTVEYTSTGFQPPQTAAEATPGPHVERLDFTQPRVAMDTTGDAVVIATVTSVNVMADQFSSSIFSVRRPAGSGTWQGDSDLDTVTSSLSVSPRPAVGAPTVTFTSSGAVVAAWTKGATARIVRSRSAPGVTGAWDATQDIPGSSDVRTDAFPELASLAGGGTMLAFEGASLKAATRPSGGPFGSATTVLAGASPDLALAGDGQGDAVAAVIRSDPDAGHTRVASLIYDGSPPEVHDVSVPAGGAAGQSLAMNASAADAFSPVAGIAWSFGDGATATGTQVSHAYSTGGSFSAAVAATDAVGNTSAPTARAIAISGGTGPGGDVTAPQFLDSLALTPNVFRSATGGPSVIASRGRPIGTTVTFSLDEAAATAFTVRRAKPGRRAGKRCVKPSHRNRKGRRCTRYVLLPGGFAVAAGAGQTHFRFTGRVGNRKLKPGKYRLVAVATDAAGNTSKAARASFRLVKK